jgi:hypothetical protein
MNCVTDVGGIVVGQIPISRKSSLALQAFFAGKECVHPIVSFAHASKLSYQEAPVMTESTSVADKAIERILELSADLQIKRRATAKWSLAFYDFSVAIAAYGEALEVLTKLQREEEERSVSLDLLRLLECPPEPHAVL